MSKRGDRAKHNRKDKKREPTRKLNQGLAERLDRKMTESLAANSDHLVTNPLRQLTGDHQSHAAAFERVVYRFQQGEQSD